MRERARLSPREIQKAWLVLGETERAQAEARILAGKTLAKFRGGSDEAPGRVVDKIGRIAGTSGRTVEKCLAVYAAADQDPGLFGDVVDYLERTSNFHDAYNRMRRTRDLARVRCLAPIAGRFSTLVLDPPWEDDSVSPNQRPPYATMPVAEIAAMPVPGWGLEQGHIYVHAPGPFVRIAVELVEVWRYDFKQVLVYRKREFSMGRYFRTKNEFVVFGTRGGLMLARQDLPNEFEGTPGAHSEKPASFYQLVRAASPGPYGEAFQRGGPPDFVNLYQPAPPAAIGVAAE